MISNSRLNAYRCSSALTSSVKALVSMISKWNGREVCSCCGSGNTRGDHDFAARNALLLQHSTQREFDEANIGETARSEGKKIYVNLVTSALRSPQSKRKYY